MWSNVISIDKRYSKEIDCIKERVENMRDLSFAVEESKDRIWIYLASLCEKSARLEEEITLLCSLSLVVVILSYICVNFKCLCTLLCAFV